MKTVKKPSKVAVLEAELSLLQASAANEAIITTLTNYTEVKGNLGEIVGVIAKHGIDDSLISLLGGELCALTPDFANKKQDSTIAAIRRAIEEVEEKIADAVKSIIESTVNVVTEFSNTQSVLSQKLTADLDEVKKIEAPEFANGESEVTIPKVSIEAFGELVTGGYEQIEAITKTLAANEFDGTSDTIKSFVNEEEISKFLSSLGEVETKKVSEIGAPADAIKFAETVVGGMAVLTTKNTTTIEQLKAIAAVELKEEPTEKPEGYVGAAEVIAALNKKLVGINDTCIKYLEAANTALSAIKKNETAPVTSEDDEPEETPEEKPEESPDPKPEEKPEETPVEKPEETPAPVV
jgi:hypothetical protein